jgi:hypothetical protein
VTLSGVPGKYVFGLLGTQSGGSCGTPAALFIAQPSTNEAVWTLDSGSGFQTASLQYQAGSSQLTVNVSDPSLAKPFDCVIAETSSTVDDQVALDSTAPLTLAADAPPAATPTPAPAPVATPAPGPTKAATPPVPVPRTAKLTATLGGVPKTIKRNHTITLELQLGNEGTKSTGSVIVSLSRPRGLSLSHATVKVARFKPAQHRTLRLKLKLTARAKKATTFKVTARSGRLKASSSVLLTIGKAKKVPPVKTAPASSAIAGTYWWRTVNHVDYAWDNRGLYFVDDHTVYSGMPKGGLPATCTTPPAHPDQEIDQQDGCLPYTWDAKTGALTIGDKTGTFTPSGGLTLDGNAYSATQIPAAGATYGFNEEEHTDFTGMCGLIVGCTITEQYLTLEPDGQFVLSHSTTASVGDPGVGPYTVAGNYPPDQHGTYAVQAGGRIHLAFADGSVKDETFAVQVSDKTHQPDPVGEGVILDDVNFYPDPTP